MVSYFKGRLYKIAMTMKSVELEFLGVHMMEPEDFLCALLAHPDSHKIVPVWMSLSDGARLSSRADGYNPSRPDTHDLLLEMLEAQGGVTSIVINNVHEGAFYVEVTTGEEKNLDARVSDALVLSMHFNVPLTIDEELLGKVGLYVTEDDLDQYFHIDYEATSFVPGESSRPDDEDSESTSASGDAQADADFSELMKSMGLSEDELRLDADVDDAADDEAADDGQTSIDDFLDAEDEDDSDGGENQR